MSVPSTSDPAATRPDLLGEKRPARFSQTETEVWIGLLETHKRLTRALNAELEAEHGLSLSALELLSRLSAAEDQVLRLSDLAERSGLSLSRVSRIVDTLEARGLVERRRCPDDRRARNASLTAAGASLLEAAQATHSAGAHARFFAQVEPAELDALAAVFGRLAPGAARSCT
ncbi:MAG: MarR family transcriptional regulator [Thermoleophilaceae bacterium]|nr:MarR family transcriptional regulator [Thermoleophilaceae bacterium]